MTPLDRDGRSALHYAARDGDLIAARKLVAAGMEVNLQDKDGWSPLHFAAQARSADLAEFLINHGAIVDAQDRFGNTPLAKATFESRGDGAVIKILRAAGADPEKQNKSGISPVSLARMIANFDVARFYDDLPKA